MKESTKPIYKVVVIVNSRPLAYALIGRLHDLSPLINKHSGKPEWQFTYSVDLMGDISLYENNCLEVNAQDHYRVLTGSPAEEDESYQEKK